MKHNEKFYLVFNINCEHMSHKSEYWINGKLFKSIALTIIIKNKIIHIHGISGKMFIKSSQISNWFTVLKIWGTG